MIKKFIILLALFYCLDSWGATYYVRDNTACANNGDGSAYACASGSGQPGAIRNFANALLATFAAGDTVYICGTITSGSSFQWTNAMESGSAGNPIVVDGNCPKGDGTYDPGAFATTAAYALRVVTTGPDYITLRNLTFSGGTTDNLSFNLGTTTGWRLEDIVSQDTAGDGVDIDDAADNGITIDGMIIRRAALNGLMCNSSAGWTWRDIEVYDSGTSGANNYDGIGVNDGCGTGSVLTDVEVYRQLGNLGGGIDAQDSTGTGTFVLRRAFIYGGEGSGLTATANTGNLRNEFYSVISVGNLYGFYLKDSGSGGHHIFNSTFYGNTTSEAKFGDTGTSGDVAVMELKNSSVGGERCLGEAVFFRDNATITLTSNYNHFCPGGDFNMVAGGTKTFTTWKSSASQDANSIEADPLFVGGSTPTTAAGFKLSGNSPLRRAGLDLNIGNVQDHGNRAFAHPPSIGAWEAASGDSAEERTLRD